jgi:hypothetical protein
LNAIAVLPIAGDIRQQQIDAATEVSHAKPKRFPQRLFPQALLSLFSLDSFFVSCFAVLFNSLSAFTNQEE